MSSYTEIFTASVPVEKGCLSSELKAWFAEQGSPVLSEGDRVMVAEAADWDAFASGAKVWSGTVPLKFRFRNKPLAMMFKLTWHSI